jgi:ABC-type dipeptide/oligopeptide/nickel transport system permease subunit
LTDATDRTAGLGVGAAITSARRSLVARYPLAACGALVIVLIVLAAIFAPLLGTGDPLALNPMQRLRPPGDANWLGTDQFGRDLWTRIVYGTRVSLIVGFIPMVFTLLIGVTIGLIAGYAGGWLDNLMMRIMDVLLAFPALVLAIAIVTVLGPGLINAQLAIGIVAIPVYARVMRASVLAIRERDFVTASRALGESGTGILFRRIMPNALTPLIVQGTLGIAGAILEVAALSFLGLGVPQSIPSWGRMLAEAADIFDVAWWLMFFPGLFLIATTLAFNLLGDGLRDALDPRSGR